MKKGFSSFLFFALAKNNSITFPENLTKSNQKVRSLSEAKSVQAKRTVYALSRRGGCPRLRRAR